MLSNGPASGDYSLLKAHSPLPTAPQHISSRRHRDGVAGKPNPLLSRHKKPRGAAELAVRPGCWGNGLWEDPGKLERDLGKPAEVGLAGLLA